jgi:hypothetical protein
MSTAKKFLGRFGAFGVIYHRSPTKEGPDTE